MRKLVSWGTVFAVVMGFSTGASGAGAAADGNLQLTLPYVEYAGQRYHLVLDYAPEVPGGVYWKYNIVYPTDVAGPCGGSADQGLNISNVCVLFGGKEYRINLDYAPDPEGMKGLYWKFVGALEELPCSVTRVTGAGVECFDLFQYSQVIDCMTGCGEGIDCILQCFEGGFQLGLQFQNPTGLDLDCVIPPGAVFEPEDGSVQTMMVLHEEPFPVPAGTTQDFCVTAYCLNSDLSAPSETDAFGTGSVVAESCLVEIVQYTYGKTIQGQAVWRIQNIAWECVETGEISAANRAYLEGL